MECKFCPIREGTREAAVVFQDDVSIAFLDHRPLFPGHCLLLPVDHVPTLTDLDDTLLNQIFLNSRLLARAVEVGMEAEGTFVAINNRGQSERPAPAHPCGTENPGRWIAGVLLAAQAL